MNDSINNLNCTKCTRLSNFIELIKVDYPNYHNKPVQSFGCNPALVLIVGLAPGLHGANATGRPFTGDQSGNLLHKALYKYGFSSQAKSISINDNLRLINCRITNAVRCLPPLNKPSHQEINNCSSYLFQEIKNSKPKLIICLGNIAHNAVCRVLNLKGIDFKHGNKHKLGKICILDSYHPSRLNINTNRLTESMFFSIFMFAKNYIKNI